MLHMPFHTRPGVHHLFGGRNSNLSARLDNVRQCDIVRRLQQRADPQARNLPGCEQMWLVSNPPGCDKPRSAGQIVRHERHLLSGRNHTQKKAPQNPQARVHFDGMQNRQPLYVALSEQIGSDCGQTG